MKKSILSLASLLLLAGCVIDAPIGMRGRTPQTVTPTGVDGNWGDAGGVATSTLNNGSFVSVANDTGNRVAEGNYRYTDQRNIELNYYSILRETNVRANCLLATQNQLNCTNEAGQQFSLIRKASLS